MNFNDENRTENPNNPQDGNCRTGYRRKEAQTSSELEIPMVWGNTMRANRNPRVGNLPVNHCDGIGKGLGEVLLSNA